MLWDVFCKVVDNFGDIGVCWRLAQDLARRGETVRLWIDDASALAWMAPSGAVGVEVAHFDAARQPGDVVVEAFGCNPPAHFVIAMAGRKPLWINLEYLSAEAYVERSHGLPSPQANGLMKWFFYPGFTHRTGGLLREPGLMAERASFDRDAWLAGLGLAARPGERLASLFCYDGNLALPALLQSLSQSPCLLLLTQGAPQRMPPALPPGLRMARLPWLSQTDFDRLLWSCDLNFVRGEDSLVRAIWAGAPFIWQIYPQHDGAHGPKLRAFLDRFPPPPGLAPLWFAWNGLQAQWPGLPAAAAWQSVWQPAFEQWRATLLDQRDLVSQLRDFARSKAQPDC
jgi:uncharacterized repeat protein (TIGR03837 family)